MTEHDKQLIEKANSLHRFHYNKVLDLIEDADTAEARERLRNIYLDLYWATLETL